LGILEKLRNSGEVGEYESNWRNMREVGEYRRSWGIREKLGETLRILEQVEIG
jgi:hypothetical protein